MTTSAQYMQSGYVPTVIYKQRGSSQSLVLPDWLGAGYVDLADNITQYDLYTVQDSDIGLPDGIAYRAYGNSNWWWVICDFNGIVDPFNDMTIGQVIKIPSLLEVTLFLQKIATVGSKRTNNIGKYVSI